MICFVFVGFGMSSLTVVSCIAHSSIIHIAIESHALLMYHHVFYDVSCIHAYNNRISYCFRISFCVSEGVDMYNC